MTSGLASPRAADRSATPVDLEPARGRWRMLAPLCVAALALAILVARTPAGAWDVAWAEDGRNFLADAAAGDTNPFLPTAGYLHVVPRMVALVVVQLVPVEAWASAVTLAALALVAAAAAATWKLSRAIVPWGPARLGLSLVPAVAPVMGLESLGNLANLHTTCFWLAVWILLAPPSRGAARIAWAAVLLLCMLTEVQAVLLVPLAIGHLVVHRRAGLPTSVAALVGAAAQGTSMLLAPRGGYPDIGLGVPDVVLAWLVQSVLPLLSTDAVAVLGAIEEHGVGIAVAAAVPFVVAGVVVVVLGTVWQRVTAVVLALASAGIMAGCVLTSQLEVWRYSALDGEEWLSARMLFRYGAAASLYLAALWCVAIGVVVDRARGTRRTVLARAVGGAVVLGSIVWMLVLGTAVPSERTDGPSWSEGVESGVASCEAGAWEVDVPLAPAGWDVATLPCSVLER